MPEPSAHARALTVLVDGRSGSGKTEFARALVDGWPHAQLLRLDDFYPGWDGLAAASRALPGILLSGRWQDWDWASDRAGAWHELHHTRPLVVEGVGALSAASRALADRALWVELAAPARKARALARDGGVYEPHWDSWAAQEEDFIAREDPAALADEVLNGTNVTAEASRWRALLRAECARSESMGE